MTVTDDERVARATRDGRRMLGPLERERCARHPRRWRIFRWVWSVDGDITASEPRLERDCADCLTEENNDE